MGFLKPFQIFVLPIISQKIFLLWREQRDSNTTMLCIGFPTFFFFKLRIYISIVHASRVHKNLVLYKVGRYFDGFLSLVRFLVFQVCPSMLLFHKKYFNCEVSIMIWILANNEGNRVVHR